MAIIGVETGFIVLYGGSTTPEGWLTCDGSAVSRTTYADLYADIGTTFGVGDGSTTFNLPDCAGRSIRGSALAGTGGVESHSVSESELPAHTHSYRASSGVAGNFGDGPYLSADMMRSYTETFNDDNAGSGTAHDNMPPFLVLEYIIKT